MNLKNFTFDEEWLRQSAQIEDESDCDIAAGMTDAELMHYLNIPFKFWCCQLHPHSEVKWVEGRPACVTCQNLKKMDNYAKENPRTHPTN